MSLFNKDNNRIYTVLTMYYNRLLSMLLQRYKEDESKYTKDYIEWRERNFKPVLKVVGYISVYNNNDSTINEDTVEKIYREKTQRDPHKENTEDYY